MLRTRIGQPARYGIVGGGFAAILYSFDLALNRFFPNAVVRACPLSSLIASVAGLVLFVEKRRVSARNKLRYALSVAANMALASLLLVAALPLFRSSVAKLLSDSAVIAVSYFAGRHVVFTAIR